MMRASAPLSEDVLRYARRSVNEGRFREAITQLTEVEAWMATSAEWQLLMAMASWRVGNFERSHSAANGALSGYRSRGDADGEMRALNVAAAGHFALGALAEAEEDFGRALELARRFDDRLMMARCENNLGSVAYYLDRWPEALRHYENAAGLFGRVGSLHGEAQAAHNIGVVFREQGDLPSARRFSDRALEAAERLGDGRAIGWSLAGRGETDALKGDLPLARAKLDRALTLARQCDDRLTEIECLRVQAFIARGEGDLDRSIVLSRDALSLAERVGHPWFVAKANHQLAESLLANEQVTEAADAFLKAADAFTSLGSTQRGSAMHAERDRIVAGSR